MNWPYKHIINVRPAIERDLNKKYSLNDIYYFAMLLPFQLRAKSNLTSTFI